ncbi:ABC transporter permease [Salmonella enterica]|uniref:Transport permease protein n=1 Tax=Salmonella enterica subsp. enterica serovar Karamoja TaxID=2500153 RepID=A0A3T0CI73_SALET|nr:hypothetical protein EL007_24070 [Salmonella enterica subsp. enterica serovar Karamoja]
MKNYNFSDFFCLLKSELLFSCYSWMKIVAQPIVFSMLYFFIIKIIMNKSVNENADYLTFIASGIIFQNMCNFAIITTSSSIFQRKISNSFDSVLVAPISNFRVIVAFMVGGVLRSLLIGMIIYTAAFMSLDIHVYSLMEILFTTLLSLCFFSLIGVCIGLYITKFETLSNFSMFFLSPIMMISGVFSDVGNYQNIFKYLVYSNPFYWLLCFFRAGFIGGIFKYGSVLTLIIIALVYGLYFYTSILLSHKERQHI